MKKISALLLAITLGMLSKSAPSFAETTTTTEQVTTESHVVPRVVHHRARRARPVSTRTLHTTETIVQTTPRKILDEDMLKKISSTLCTEGFKAYVSRDRKNVCQGMAMAPDLAYSCVWNKSGASAFSPVDQGPCNLDFVEHRGSVIITKNDYQSNPPLSYGVEAQCCFRAAQDPVPSTSTSTSSIKY